MDTRCASQAELEDDEDAVRSCCTHNLAEALLDPDEEARRARTALKQEIEALLAPHTTAIERPPFTGGELIVMAALCYSTISVNTEKILIWLVTNFPHYTRLAARQYLTHEDRDDETHPYDIFYTRSCYYLPLLGKGAYPSRYSTLAALGPDESFVVATGSARAFLSSWLEPPRRGYFPFLKLPVELRVRVYESAVCLPGSYVQLDHGDWGVSSRLHFSTRQQHDPLPMSQYPENFARHRVINPQSVGSLISPLLVNKQFYHEAIQHFYALNLFRFRAIEALPGFVYRVPGHLLEHVSHVHINIVCSVDYLNQRMHAFENAVKNLLACRHLRKVELVFRASTFAHLEHDHAGYNIDNRMSRNLNGCPGIDAIAQLACKADVAVVGDLALPILKIVREKLEQKRRLATLKGKGEA